MIPVVTVGGVWWTPALAETP